MWNVGPTHPNPFKGSQSGRKKSASKKSVSMTIHQQNLVMMMMNTHPSWPLQGLQQWTLSSAPELRVSTDNQIRC